MSRTLIQLVDDVDRQDPVALTDRSIKSWIDTCIEKAKDGSLTEEHIEFAKARRDYISDENLKLITGKTYEEIEKASKEVKKESKE
jgi:hypothetical protein